MPRHQRILVADGSKYFDTSMWRKLIPDAEFEIVGLAGSPDETLKMAITLSPDIVLVDLSHSQTCGLQTVIALHNVDPHVPIITFMPISSHEYTRASLDAGAIACLTKSEVANMLVQTLRHVTPPGLVTLPVS
jgi:DNA-binding NarL/FixJ family response regulator